LNSGGDLLLARKAHVAHVLLFDCLTLISGVCPQHNILFDLLTVREHLEMFALIKGMNRADVPAAVAEMIKEVSLLIV